MHRTRIGARQDQNVSVGFRVDRGANFHARFLARDHLFAARVAAFFRADLILDHHRGGAGTGIFDHGALHIQRVAVAGVAVANQRNFCGRVAAIAHTVEHLGERDKAGIGQAEPRS